MADLAKKRDNYKRWLKQNPDARDVRQRINQRFYQNHAEDLREAAKWRWLRRQYGMTKEEYETRLAAQDGKCAICGSADPKGRNGHSRFCVDHDHLLPANDPKSHRDLLCTPCNVLLGNANDDPEVLKKAAAYLERHRLR